VSDDLDPLAPDDAMEMWLERQQATKADETIQSYRYRLEQFVGWCDQQRITNLNDLTERDVFRFDNECRSDDLSVSTLNNRLGTLKLFLAFCQKMNAVTEDVVTAVDVPPLDVETRVDDEMLNTERAKTILG
jgi:site-specific recombinase XerD